MKRLFNVLTALTITAAMLLTGCSGNGENTDGGGITEVNAPTSEEESNSNTDSGDKLKIGIIQLVEQPSLDEAREGFMRALSENGLDESKVEIDYQNGQNDMSNLKTISQKFVTDKKDLILAIATSSAQSVVAETSEIPILFTAVTDPVGAGLVNSIEAPGANVTGTSDLTPVIEQLKLLVDINPDTKNVAVLYSSGEQNSAVQADMAEEAASQLGLSIERKTVTSTNDVAQVVESIVNDDFDGIFIPTDNTIASSMSLVSSITTPAKIPVVVGANSMMNDGALASIGINYDNLGYITGEMAVDVLLNGASTAEMPVQYISEPDLKINAETLKQIDITLSDELTAKANFINSKEQ